MQDKSLHQFHELVHFAVALNHPNVAPVDAIDEDRGIHLVAEKEFKYTEINEREAKVANPADGHICRFLVYGYYQVVAIKALLPRTIISPVAWAKDLTGILSEVQVDSSPRSLRWSNAMQSANSSLNFASPHC